MRRVRSRMGLVAVASALIVSACAAGSDDAADPSPVAPVVTEPLETDPPETQSVGTDPVETVPVETDPVESDPVEGGEDGKDVVTRSVGADEDGVLPEGVGSVTARVTSADGDVCEVCLWLADDDLSRQRGLMGVTDLGDAVGMAFVWERSWVGNFFMFQTPTPLSIAWFDDAGEHVGQADMEPCLVDDSATCERYTADSRYVLAVEMFGGQLDAIGIGPGANVELLDLPCA